MASIKPVEVNKLSEQQEITKEFIINALTDEFDGALIAGIKDGAVSVRYTGGIPIMQLIGMLESAKWDILKFSEDNG